MRLIDADELEKHFLKYTNAWVTVNTAPTIDAVEVVRCKECKYWEKRGRCKDGDYDYDYGECMAVDQTIDGVLNYVGENHYCSYGDKKE